jgi:uncharacterized HAD superfamily protein
VRIGFDIDGVLADFATDYQNLVIQVSGKNLFAPTDAMNPPCWDWPEYRGYTKETMKEVWGCIVPSNTFWYGLLPFADSIQTMTMLLRELEHRHDVYYVTSRPGATVKRQTEAWLMRYLPYAESGLTPTVIISSEKGLVARALKLDAYVDDNLDNIKGVLKESPKTRAYLLDKSYNLGAVEEVIPSSREIAPGVPAYSFEVRRGIRIKSLGAMFDAEIANL